MELADIAGVVTLNLTSMEQQTRTIPTGPAGKKTLQHTADTTAVVVCLIGHRYKDEERSVMEDKEEKGKKP